MGLTVLDPGLLSLVVDFGRPRSRALGVPVGGAADRAALALANALVGNPPDAAGLEFTLRGPTLRAEHRTAAVVFGAPFTLSADGRPLTVGTTFTLNPGEVLRVGGAPTGARGYLCVAGGFDAAAVLGSRSGLEPVRAGDALACRASRCDPRGLGFASLVRRDPEPSGPGSTHDPGFPPRAIDCRPFGTSVFSPEGAVVNSPGWKPWVMCLRALDGPQRDWFADDTFFTAGYEVAAASNRMGLRLTGPPLARRPGELVSEAVAPGAVQVANDGLPIVLGVDGQTIGGYPKVAHVARADLDLLAQLRPGDRVRFVRVSQDEAEAAARERAAELRVWLTRLSIAEREPRFE